MKHRLLLILTGILLLAACESYDCTLYNYVGMYSQFYQNGAKVKLNDTLTITSGKSGRILLNRSVGSSRIILPLSYWQDVDTLVFSVKNSNSIQRDSVWIVKSNLVHYESPDCPATLFHTIQEVRCTHEFIESINIIRSSVNYDQTDNLQIIIASASN